MLVCEKMYLKYIPLCLNLSWLIVYTQTHTHIYTYYIKQICLCIRLCIKHTYMAVCMCIYLCSYVTGSTIILIRSLFVLSGETVSPQNSNGPSVHSPDGAWENMELVVDRGKPKDSNMNPSHCHVVHHKQASNNICCGTTETVTLLRFAAVV